MKKSKAVDALRKSLDDMENQRVARGAGRMPRGRSTAGSAARTSGKGVERSTAAGSTSRSSGTRKSGGGIRTPEESLKHATQQLYAGARAATAPKKSVVDAPVAKTVKYTGPFPKTTGACIDRMDKLKEDLSKLNKQAETLQREYAGIEDHLIASLARSELHGAQGSRKRVEVEDVPLPSVEDWDKLYKHIAKTQSWELLQKRVAVGAWRERLQQHVVVPGTKVFNKVVLKLLKATRK